jgi:hypothetical protein
MLGGRDGSRSLGPMPPVWRRATLEKLAVNAVMAGCEPAAFPIIVAAVEAMLDPTFNLYGVQATTHPVAPLLIVNGPYGRKIGLHGGSGCFGPGFRANATLGRAIRLILLNVGGAWPGRYDMATQGSPAKLAYCIAENEEASPWGPLCKGDVVTVYGGEGPHNVNDHISTTAAGILANVADTAISLGSNVGLVLLAGAAARGARPEHAATIAGDGLSSRRRAALRLRERAPAARPHAAGRDVRHARLAGVDERHDRRRGAAAARAVAGGHLRDRRRWLGQALGGGAQLHLQPRGEPSDPRRLIRQGSTSPS